MSCKLCDPLTTSISGFHVQNFQGQPLESHVWLYDYENARDVIRRAKYYGESSHYWHHAQLLAHAISTSLDDSSSIAVTYVPTIEEHINSRGRDHARVLARAVARYLGRQGKDLLLPTHRSTQAHSGVKKRQRNPHYANLTSLENTTVVLIDDVATTRTTLEHAARSLVMAGAKRVIGVTIAYQPCATKLFR